MNKITKTLAYAVFLTSMSAQAMSPSRAYMPFEGINKTNIQAMRQLATDDTGNQNKSKCQYEISKMLFCGATPYFEALDSLETIEFLLPRTSEMLVALHGWEGHEELLATPEVKRYSKLQSSDQNDIDHDEYVYISRRVMHLHGLAVKSLEEKYMNKQAAE